MTYNCRFKIILDLDPRGLSDGYVNYLDVVKTPHAGAAEQSKLQKDFKTFYSQYDKRTGKDFEKTFPIIGEWYRGI